MNLIEETRTATQKLRQLKKEIKNCIINQTFELPLYTYHKQFNFETLKYENYKKNRMMINLSTTCTVTRVLEIIQIVLGLIEKGQYITKRNLYYKLIHYYKAYSLVDADIEMITFNTDLTREDLQIVSSSRCLILGNLTLYIDQSQLKCASNMITNITNFRRLKGIVTDCANLFIIEKESALHQINQQLTKYFDRNQEPQWFKSTIFITAKGYPDNACRDIVQNLSNKVQKVYYLGDEDIYGVDILLTYAIGFNKFNTILHKITWVSLSIMIDQKDLQFQYQLTSKEDKKKYLEIFNRRYIKDIDDFLPKGDFEEKFKNKMVALKHRLKQIKQKDKKIELQSYFKYLPGTWIESIIKNDRL